MYFKGFLRNFIFGVLLLFVCVVNNTFAQSRVYPRPPRPTAARQKQLASEAAPSNQRLVKQTAKAAAEPPAITAAPPPQIEDINAKIARIARANNLNLRLFQALIFAESANKPRAVSYKGAACLTQLMPPTARRFGLIVDLSRGIDERLTNVDKCLGAGAKYLRWLLDTFHGDVRLALAGYNAGEGAVIQYGYRIPPYEETILYVEKICYFYTGQTGHGVAMAYNQDLARRQTGQLYDPRSKKYILRHPIARVQPSHNVQKVISAEAMSYARQKNSDSEETAAASGNDSDAAEIARLEQQQPAKPKVTRVEINQNAPPPRIPSASLFYWNKQNR